MWKQFVWLFAISALVTSTDVAADWPTYLSGNERAGFTATSLDPSLKLAWQYSTAVTPEQAWTGPREAPIEGHQMLDRLDYDDGMQVVIDGDRAYFGDTVDHRLHCVDAKTGEPVWDFYTDGPIRLAPTLAHGNVYFGSDDGRVYCLNAANGRLVWDMRVSGKDERLLSRGEMISRWPVRTGVLVEGEIAYFGAGVFPHETVYLCAVNAKDGSIVWRNDTISEQDAGRNDLSPQGYLLSAGEFLYVPSGRSLPVAFSKKTGEIVFQRKYSWRTSAGGVVGGTKALLGDGLVYAGGPHHFLAMEGSTGDLGEAWINGRQMVLAGPYAYLADGDRVFCVNRLEHAKASQEKQKWFLAARQNRRDAKKAAEAKKKMQEFMQVGILWQHSCKFDDVLIATDNLVIAGGENEVVALDRQSGKVQWQHKVEGRVKGLSADTGLLTVSTDLGKIYGFRSDVADEKFAQWPAKFVEPFPQDKLSKFYRDAAQQILDKSEQQTGYCLVIGNERGRLAYELARQSELTVYAIEPDETKAAEARQRLEKAGIHGSRITIVHSALDAIPFSNYFANLIVSDSMLLTGQLPGDPELISRHLKPCGGTIMLGQPSGGPAANQTATSEEIVAWLSRFYSRGEGNVTYDDSWYSLVRGKLPGAGNWSHQYGNVANTSVSQDNRIRSGLSVLWYGDPGPSAMINRHEAAGAPLSTNGRMFIQGTDRLMAYDAYNGNFLWDYENPGAVRTGVFNNRETHNLAASDDILFAAVNDECLAHDAATGKILKRFQTPESSDGIERAWAYLAYDRGQLFGTSTIREELESRLRRRGLTVKTQTDAIFAYDVESGERIWEYRGQNILHTTIAVGPERVYFIDSSLTPAERQQLYLREKPELKKLTGKEAEEAEAKMKAYDVRLAVAIDRKTGAKVWEKPVDVTDTTNVSAGGGSLTLMYADGHIVLCGANANGHYWRQFLSGEFEKRKLIVLSADDGKQVWAKNANYMNRPAVINGEIYAEPWAFNLYSGEPKTTAHPLTGEESQWRFSRPGHHCGIISATPNMMFFRSGFIGYYDLYNDSGTKHFAGQRLGCWVNAIPGNGLVMIPEASAGCVCQFSIASTVVLEPTQEESGWGIFSAVGDSTPVKRIGINFGAPGDRKDNAGKSWFGYPRPNSRGRLEFVFDLKPEMTSGGGWYSRNLDAVQFTETDTPWLFTSGARGLRTFKIPLLGSDDQPSRYNVTFHFANLESAKSGPFEIKLQGTSVESNATISGARGPVTPRSLSYEGILVEDHLSVELAPEDPKNLPVLSAIEVERME